MDRWQSWLVVGILVSFSLGCGKSQSAATGGTDGQAAISDAMPDAAVKEFLSAAKGGDQKRLTVLLSSKAKEEAAKNNVNFELDAYQNASFEVGEFEYLTEAKDVAHVGCKWTDRDPDGSAYTHPVVWLMKKENSAWRVAGMILRPFPDKPPVTLDYEDTAALVNAKQYIEREYQHRMQEEQQQEMAAKPLTAGQPGATPATAGQQATTAGPSANVAQQPSQQTSGDGPAFGQQPIQTTVPQSTVPQTAQRPSPTTIQQK